MTLVAEPLGDHDLDGFRSGNAEPDDWLIRSARAAIGQGTRTWVVVDGDGFVRRRFSPLVFGALEVRACVRP